MIFISVKYADIPDYLRSSKFYEGLDPGDHSEISVPEICFKENTSINNETDFYNLLHTIRFWMLGDPHLKILTFLLTNDAPLYLHEESEQWSLLMSLPFGEDYLDLKALPWYARVAFAVRNDMSFDIVSRLHHLGNGLPPNMCDLAAKANRIDILQFARFEQCLWGNTATIATARGHLECLDYAFNNGCPMTVQVIDVAAEKGQLRCLRYLSSIFLLRSSALLPAAKHGHLDCLQYIHEQGVVWDAQVTEFAAKGGHLDCLIYAYQNGCQLTTRVVDLACARGDLACLHYAVKHGCRVEDHVCLIAARAGHVSCLAFAHNMGGSWDKQTCRLASRHGHLHCLKYLHEHGCPWDEDVLLEALWNDHPHITWYALLHGCPCEEHKQLLYNYLGTFVCLLSRYLFPTTVSLTNTLCAMGFLWFWAVFDVLYVYQNKLAERHPTIPVKKVMEWCRWGVDVLYVLVLGRGAYVVYTYVCLFAGYYD